MCCIYVQVCVPDIQIACVGEMLLFQIKLEHGFQLAVNLVDIGRFFPQLYLLVFNFT